MGDISRRHVVTALVPALALVLLLVAPVVVHAGSTVIAFDFANETDNNGSGFVSSLSWSHTVGSGSGRILLAGVEFAGAVASGVTTVTYTANSMTFTMTFLNSKISTGAAGAPLVVEVYYLLNPPTGPGTVTVTLAFSSDAAMGGSVSFFNVGGIGGSAVADDAVGTISTMQLMIPANSGDLVFDALATELGSTVTPGAGQVEPTGWAHKEVNSVFLGAASFAPDPTPVTMSWTTNGTLTGNHWVMVAADLQPAPVVPEYPLGLPLLSIFMVIAYGLIKRRTRNPESI